MTETTITPAQDTRRIRWGWIAAGFLLLIAGACRKPSLCSASLLLHLAFEEGRSRPNGARTHGRTFALPHPRDRHCRTLRRRTRPPRQRAGIITVCIPENHGALALAINSRPQTANCFTGNRRTRGQSRARRQRHWKLAAGASGRDVRCRWLSLCHLQRSATARSSTPTKAPQPNCGSTPSAPPSPPIHSTAARPPTAHSPTIRNR